MAVYFLLNEESGTIKIGFSGDDLIGRISDLQVGNHADLTLLGSVEGDRDTERYYQERFRADHIRGDWFRATSALLKEVRDILAGEKNRPALYLTLGQMTAFHELADKTGIPFKEHIRRAAEIYLSEQTNRKMPKPSKTGEKAALWLVKRFRERKEWHSEELFSLAKQHGIGRAAIFEAKDILCLPDAKEKRSDFEKQFDMNADTCFVWWVPNDWQPPEEYR